MRIFDRSIIATEYNEVELPRQLDPHRRAASALLLATGFEATSPFGKSVPTAPILEQQLLLSGSVASEASNRSSSLKHHATAKTTALLDCCCYTPEWVSSIAVLDMYPAPLAHFQFDTSPFFFREKLIANFSSFGYYLTARSEIPGGLLLGAYFGSSTSRVSIRLVRTFPARSNYCQNRPD